MLLGNYFRGAEPSCSLTTQEKSKNDSGVDVRTSDNIGKIVELSKKRDVYILGGQSVFEQFMPHLS